MSILDDILKEIPGDNALDQLRELCDIIFDEEKPNYQYPKLMVKGSNIFLCVEVPGRTQKEIAFLALERESQSVYLAVLWTYQKSKVEIPAYLGQSAKAAAELAPPAPKKRRVWKIEQENPKKILTEYAKVIKYLKGE